MLYCKQFKGYEERADLGIWLTTHRVIWPSVIWPTANVNINRKLLAQENVPLRAQALETPKKFLRALN